MPRRRAHAPLDVYINGRLVGYLAKENDGAIRFAYAERWLEWQYAFAISLSLPLRPTPYVGAPVAAVFDNLLPDSADIRRRVAERTGAAGTDAYSLLEWSREKTNSPFSRDVTDAIEKHRKTLAI